MRLKCNAVVGVSGARNSSNGMACSSSITTAPQCPKAKDAGLKNSGSTGHLHTAMLDELHHLPPSWTGRLAGSEDTGKSRDRSTRVGGSSASPGSLPCDVLGWPYLGPHADWRNSNGCGSLLPALLRGSWSKSQWSACSDKRAKRVLIVPAEIATTPTNAQMAKVGFRFGDQLRCTTHLLPGVVCRRRTEHVRPEVVPADASRRLDCDASFRRYTATVVPPCNGWRLNSEDGRQAELATRLLNCSIKGCHVHGTISPQLTLDCKPTANRIALAFH